MSKPFVLTYLVPYGILLLLATALLIYYPQQPLHLLLNTYHSAWLDCFFRVYTHLAEWPLYLVALIPLFWKRTRVLTLVYALSEGFSACLIQLLKHILRMPRPAAVFADHMDQLQLVAGVHLHHSNSFPSGHAATFFVFFTLLALYLSNLDYKSLNHKFMNLSCLLLASLGAYSRVYLSQHFLLDITVGSLVGLLSALVVSFCFRHRLQIPKKAALSCLFMVAIPLAAQTTQTTFFYETFGTPTFAGSVPARQYSGWLETGVVYTGSAQIKSSGYAYLSSASTTLTISGINTTGYSNITLSVKEMGSDAAANYSIEYSTDGSNYTFLILGHYPRSTSWQTYTPTDNLPSTTNLSLRLTNKNTSYKVTFDELWLSGDPIQPARSVFIKDSLSFAAHTQTAYWATYGSDQDVFLPADVTAYSVSYSNDQLQLTPMAQEQVEINSATYQGTFLPANTGVLLCKSDMSYAKIPVWSVTNRSIPTVSNNLLRLASVPMSDTSMKYYKFAYDDVTTQTGLGFYYGADNGASFECKSKVYLALPASVINTSAPSRLTLDAALITAPSTPTSILPSTFLSSSTHKIFRSGRLYILHQGHFYDVFGRRLQ